LSHKPFFKVILRCFCVLISKGWKIKNLPFFDTRESKIIHNNQSQLLKIEEKIEEKILTFKFLGVNTSTTKNSENCLGKVSIFAYKYFTSVQSFSLFFSSRLYEILYISIWSGFTSQIINTHETLHLSFNFRTRNKKNFFTSTIFQSREKRCAWEDSREITFPPPGMLFSFYYSAEICK
jgi:hypothetical protein